ncbi:MAG: SEFIR domain-containing protein [bacterium]
MKFWLLETTMEDGKFKPKAFISYSWSSQEHQDKIRGWAERLISDGIEVVLDLYDLKEGQDKYVFMERMVTDESVTHVLVFSDKKYAEKADSRKSGVGTESQIISKEVYDQVSQTKFIPIICESMKDGSPYLPTFLKNRKWINFSSLELVNENWEILIRTLYGKPIHEKPRLGNPPAYITDNTSMHPSLIKAKFQTFKQVISEGKKGKSLYRKEFINACINQVDIIRDRERPQVENIGEKILEDSRQLIHIRDSIIDWVLFESEVDPSEEFSDALIGLIENLWDLRTRSSKIEQWRDAWHKAQSQAIYEIFLYIVAALMKTSSYTDLHNIFKTHYILPKNDSFGDEKFAKFDNFYATLEILNEFIAPHGKRFLSPSAELIKRQANRNDITFHDIIQADLLILLMAFITPGTHWYPQLFYYAEYYQEFSFFIRASRHTDFMKLALITEIEDVNVLREKVIQGIERLQVETWYGLHFINFWSCMNMDKMDKIT